MADVVIRTDNLGKRYRIGKRKLHGGVRGVPHRIANAAFDSFHHIFNRSAGSELFWALRDIGIEVHRGEVVGIIGRNGAGKSTLLKILSRITEPTTGRAEIKGRVGSLLEVGTGFHPELTGTENIYLNGSILGMKKAEIAHKFDEIVAFAEIDKFLDTPVKRYSSGMYVRLAFAVAAHLEPEILLVDEVLAVGDAAFQRKCLGKMGDVAREGRTILFVSHNMDAVVRLCHRGMLFQHGKLIDTGPIGQVVAHYLSESQATMNSFAIDYAQTTLPDGPAHLLCGEIVQDQDLLSADGVTQAIAFSHPWSIKIRYRVTRTVGNVSCGIRIRDDCGRFVLNSSECFTQMEMTREPGDYETECCIPGGLILPGNYSLDVGLDFVGGECIQGIEGLAGCTIINDDPVLGQFQDGRIVGVIGSRLTPWRTTRIQIEECQR